MTETTTPIPDNAAGTSLIEARTGIPAVNARLAPGRLAAAVLAALQVTS